MTSNITFKLDTQEVPLDELKKSINDPIMLASLDHLITTVKEELGDKRCPTHNEPPHVTIFMTQSGDLRLETVSCCDIFEEKATAPLKRKLNKTAYFKPGLKLILRVKNSKKPFVLEGNDIKTLDIGRADPHKSGDSQPQINLHDHRALEKGVSRRHARIIWHRGALHVVDNDSANGTFLNEQRLEPNCPYILHDGDTLRLGELIIHVMLAGAETTPLEN